MNFINLYKYLQRKYYDLLSYRYSSIPFVVYILCIVVFSFNCAEMISRWKSGKFKPVFGSSTQNIAGKSFQDRLCQLSPIDVVYTWVNGSDPVFLRDLQDALDSVSDKSAANDTTDARFRDKEELRYSLRSLEKFAPWVRHVYIVTNGQIPYWLNLDSPAVTLVTHEEIFPDKSDLPTFSSPAIEAHLHRIPGLSEVFIYINDDILLGKEIWPEDFYTLSKGYKIFLTWTIPDCSPECPWAWVGDGTCDQSCNTERCFFDNNDCLKESPQLYPKYVSAAKSSPLGEDKYIADAAAVEEIKNVQKMYKELKRQSSKRKLLYIPIQEPKLRRKIQSLSYPSGNATILSHDKLYRNPRAKNFNVKGKLFNLLKHDNISVNEAVRISNLKYLETKKAQRLLKKGNYKKDAKRPDKDASGKVKDLVLDVVPDEIQFLRDGDVVEHIDLRVNASASQSGNNESEKLNWRELKLTTGNNHKLDMFGESLLFVNGLYNQAFGVQIRKVPAHMPHLMVKDIMEALQHRFPNEWRGTSKHKLRHKNDMQLAFSYFYFLMSSALNKTTEGIFDDFDTDGSGTWSDREIRTLLTKLYGTPLTLPAVLEFEEMVKNCSSAPGYYEEATAAPNDRYADSLLPPVTKKLVKSCGPLVELLAEEFSTEKVYKYEVVYEKYQDSVFKGLVNNLSLVLDALDQIRANTRKFICLNDNIMPKSNGESSADEEVIVAVLHDFYQSLFPARSTFELPSRVRNRFLHVSDYLEWQRKRMLLLAFLTFTLIACCCCCIYALLHEESNPWFRIRSRTEEKRLPVNVEQDRRTLNI